MNCKPKNYRCIAVLCLGVASLPSLAGDDCTPSWDPDVGNPGSTAITTAWTIHPDGDAFITGFFTQIGGASINRIARWDGDQWNPLGNGLNQQAFALDVFEGDVHVGGLFTTANFVSASRIARWDGATFHALGAGLNEIVLALETSSISGGESLFVGGGFTAAGGSPANYIARWDGISWLPLGDGVRFPGDAPAVFAIKEIDLGSGPVLVVGGDFSIAGDQPASNVAIWDGLQWSALGDGVDGTVRCFEVFDDGSGPALYVGGHFETAGGQLARRVARWDGSQWSAVGGSGSWGQGSSVRSLSVFDDGDGERLIAGGEFLKVDGVNAAFIAQWDGAQWSPVLGGANGTVRTLLADTDAPEPRLLIGGEFTNIDGNATVRTAIRVGCSTTTIPGDLNGDGVVDTADLGTLIGLFGTSDPTADINGDGMVDTADLGILIANFGSGSL